MGEEVKKEKRRKGMGWIFLAGMITAVALMGAAAVWHWVKAPYLVRIECRGMGIDVERMKRWEETWEDNALGIRRLAGWRVEEMEDVLGIGTGRRERAQVIGVYGAMELVEDAKICCGRYGLAVEGDYCVLSETLARHLFGGTDCCGEWVRAGEKTLWVAGVIAKEESALFTPVKDGELEMAAVELEGRMKGRERVKRLMEE